MDDRKRPIDRLAGFLGRQLLAMLFASYAVAALWPAPGLAIRSLTLGRIGVGPVRTDASLPLLMLACLLFNAGLGVDTSKLGGFLQRPRTLVAGLSANIFFPIVFILSASWWMQHFWHNHDEIQSILVGLALVASMPIAGSSTAWSQNADGDMTLSLGLVLGSTFLSPLVTPLALHAVGFVATGDYSEDLHELASGSTGSFLAIGVLAPSLLGILAGWALGRARFLAARPYIKVINSAILLALNYSNAALSLPQAIADPDLDFLTVILLIVGSLCVLAFAVGWGTARLLRAGRDRAGRADVRPGDEQQRDRAGARLDGSCRSPAGDAADYLLQHDPAPGRRRGERPAPSPGRPIRGRGVGARSRRPGDPRARRREVALGRA